MIAEGEYRYEIRRGEALLAIEEERFSAGRITGVRRSAAGSDVYEADALLDSDGLVRKLRLGYARGPFSRRAEYEVSGEFLSGNVSAVGGRTVQSAKLGRFRQVDAGLVLFRALILAHVGPRSTARWTGRVVAIDPDTLLPHSQKQSLHARESHPRVFIHELRPGDVEEIETDARGRIIRITDNRGGAIMLTAGAAH